MYNMSNNIQDDGYIILKNVLRKDQLSYALNSDNDKKVDYNLMKQFIDNEFMPTIVKNCNFIINPEYVKFRYSNNNNSTDASTFHKDIYDFTNNEIMPIYTCLCYFDETQMELIPGSHKRQFNNDNSVISSYNKKKIINIEPGDILIFHANLYHRGRNFNTSSNRRLLQVFEVFPDKESYNLNNDKLLTVISANSMSIGLVNNIIYIIAKVPFLIENINALHYLLVYHDLQYKFIFNDISDGDKKNKLVTYEPGKRMKYESISGNDPININIICQDCETIEPSYYYNFLYLLYLIVFIIIIFYVVKKLKKKGIMKGYSLKRFIRKK